MNKKFLKKIIDLNRNKIPYCTVSKIDDTNSDLFTLDDSGNGQISKNVKKAITEDQLLLEEIDGEEYIIERNLYRKKSKTGNYKTSSELNFYRLLVDGSKENLEGEGFLHFPIEVVQQCVFKLIYKEVINKKYNNANGPKLIIFADKFFLII